MQAYRDALADDNTSFVLSPDSEFFRYFDNATLPPVEQASSPVPATDDAANRAALEPAAGPAVEPPTDGEAASVARPPATASTLE
jgi:membrane protease subunit HflC